MKPILIGAIAAVLGAVVGWYLGFEIGKAMTTEEGLVGGIDAIIKGLKGGIIGSAALSTTLGIIAYHVSNNPNQFQ